MCLGSLWFTLSVSMVVAEWLGFLIIWLIMLWFCVAISYFIFIKICLIDICLLFSECGLHCSNIVVQCLLQFASVQIVLDWVVGFWVELFFSGSQLCLVYMLSWHFVTLYVTNLSLIRVYFHLLWTLLLVYRWLPHLQRRRLLLRRLTKGIQHFKRYKDSFLRELLFRKCL